MKLNHLSLRGPAAIDGLADELIETLPEQRSWQRRDLFQLQQWELASLRSCLSAYRRLSETQRSRSAALAATREELNGLMRLAALDHGHGNVARGSARQQCELLHAEVEELETEQRQLRSALRGHAEDIAEILRAAARFEPRATAC